MLAFLNVRKYIRYRAVPTTPVSTVEVSEWPGVVPFSNRSAGTLNEESSTSWLLPENRSPSAHVIVTDCEVWAPKRVEPFAICQANVYVPLVDGAVTEKVKVAFDPGATFAPSETVRRIDVNPHPLEPDPAAKGPQVATSRAPG